MPETDFYESSYRRDRDRDAYSSDDDSRYKKTTVRRYKVGSGGDHVERVEKVERVERQDDYRDYAPARQSSNNLLDISIDRRNYVPDRPRSAFDVSEARRTERDYGGGRVVYERTKELDRVDRRSDVRGRRDDDIVVESYNDRHDDGYGKVERWHRQTEYYEPSPQSSQPIVAPISVPRPQPGVVVIREKERDRIRDRDRRDSRDEDEYFYERRERRDVGPYRGEEEVTTVDRYQRRDSREGDEDRPHRRRHRHRHRHRDHVSDGDYSSDDSYYVKKTTIIRREPSPENHHRLHLAEGALAGAGLGALIGSRRNQQTGELPEHRGRKVLAGAALGALGTEVFKRAHSAYNERFNDDDGGNNDDYDRARSHSRGGGNRERSSSRHHSKLKTGLGIAAAALAVAGAAKYIQSNRIDKEERNRGRSMHRYSSEEEYGGGNRSASRGRSKSRSHSVAKVAAGTAAVAGLVHHFRSKSRQREGKPPRSHSRLRTGAEIAGAALAGAAAKKLYDRHKEKKEEEREQKEAYDSDAYSDDDYHSHGGRSRSHSRSRSAPSPSHTSPPVSGTTRAPYPPSGADPELGLVEYGDQPLYAHPGVTNATTDRSAVASRLNSYDSAADASDQEEDRRRRRRHRAQDDRADDADVESDNNKRNRSRSRLRNLAAAGAGAAAAAIGIKTLSDRKKNADKREREDRSRRGSHNDRDYGYDSDHDELSRSRRNRYRDDRNNHDAYDDYDNSRPPSPPHASGGAFYPSAPPGAPPIGTTGGLMQHPNVGTTNLHEQYPPYNPLDYSGYPPPPGPPPARDGGAADVAGPSGSAPGPAAPYPTSHPSTPATGPAPGPSVVPQGPSLGDSAAPPPAGPPAADVYEAPSASNAKAAGSVPAPDRGHGDDSILMNSRSPPAHDGDHVSAAPSSVKDGHIHDTPTDEGDSVPKAVGFAPLSPQSSRTLRRHHAEVEHTVATTASSLTSPSANDDAVEELPDRFDAQGRPLGASPGSSHGYASRHGDFAFGNRVHGQWGVASTEGDKGVDRLADNVRSILDSIGSASSGHPSGIMGVIGGVLEGLAHNGDDRGEIEDDDHQSDDGKKRKRRNTHGGDVWHSRDRQDSERGPSTAVGYPNGNYTFDRDGYDGHDARKRRRSWAS